MRQPHSLTCAGRLTADRRRWKTFGTSQYDIKSEQLFGGLSNDQQPAANTRLLSQFSAQERAYVSAYYWGHEHNNAIFKPYANVTRGRCIGNGAIANQADYDNYAVSEEAETGPWGGPPQLLSSAECRRDGCRTGKGEYYWDLGFVMVELTDSKANAKYYEVPVNSVVDVKLKKTSYGAAQVFFEERF